MNTRKRYRKRFIFIIVCYAIIEAALFGGCLCAENTPQACQDWLSKTIDYIETKPNPKRYQAVLQAVSRACPLIHNSLRSAADKAMKEPDPERRAIILGQAAKPLLPGDAPDFTSYETADRIAKLYPLAIAKDMPVKLLQDINAGTYVFAWVLEHQLLETNLYDLDGQKLILNFLLSAAFDKNET